MRKQELEDLLIAECKLKGDLSYAQAKVIVDYTPYSYRSSSVRKRRAYCALLNYLAGYYHPLTQTNCEIQKMIDAVHNAPNKFVTESDKYHFSLPESVSFVNLTEKKYVKTREEGLITREVGHFEKVPDKVTYIEEEIHKEVEGDTTDEEGWEMFQFDPDIIASYIGTSKPYSIKKWWVKNPARYNSLIPKRIHIYLMRRRYQYDGDEVTLSETLERRFHRWVEFKDDIQVIRREVRIAQPDKYVTKEIVEKGIIVREKLVNNCVKNEISKLKPNQKWVDEFVELTYLPGFSVIRGEMMPYKRINKESYNTKPYDPTIKREVELHKRRVKRATKKREKAILNTVSNEELDEIIKANMKAMIEDPKLFVNSKEFFKQGIKKFTWMGLRYMHAAIVAMKTGADAYDILRERVYENYNSHKRVIKCITDLEDY